MKYLFAVQWTLAGVTHDITELVTSPNSLNQGVGAPDQLYAFTSGDVEIEALDLINPGESSEPFISTPFFSAILNLANVPSYKEEALVTLTRDGEVIFRGLVDPITIQLDRKSRVASFVIFGGMRLCDRVLASGLKRSLPTDVRTSRLHAKGARNIAINYGALAIEPNDIITIGGEDYPASGSGTVPGTTDFCIFLNAGLKDDLPANAPILFPTPWLRNQYIGDNSQPGLVQNLLSLAGITDTDVRWTGLISNEKFLSNINSKGLYGAIGAREGLIGATRYLRVIGNDKIWQQPNQYTEPVATGLPIGAGMAGDYLNGPYTDPGIDGFKTETAPGLFTDAYQLRDDVTTCQGGSLGYGIYRIVRRTYARFGTRMYELEFTQDVRDVNYTEIAPGVPGDFVKAGLPDYASGGLGYWLFLRAWKTTDQGLTWTGDTSWIQTYSNAIVAVYGTPGATTWKYSVEFQNAQGKMLARSPSGSTASGNATLDGSNYNRVSWGATPSGTAQVHVFRELGNATIGLVAVVPGSGAGYWEDHGTAPINPNRFQCPLGWLRVEENQTYEGGSGITYDWSLAVMPYMNQGSSVTSIIYLNQWTGSAAEPVMWRVRMSGWVQNWTILHYSAHGFKVTMTNSWASYGVPTAVRHCHIYWVWAASDGPVGLVHDEDDGVNISTPTNQVFYLGSLEPFLRSLTWNGLDGVNSRVGLFFSDGVNGTSFMEFFSGGTWAIEGSSFFSRVQSVTIDPETASYVSGFMQTNTTQERISGPVWDDQQPWERGGEPAPKVGGGKLVVARWTIVIGGTTIPAWFVSNGRKTGIVSKYHNGFITVADFNELNVSAAIQELAFIVGATFDVDFNDSLQPRAQFIGRDVDSLITPKLVANLDWSLPSGANNDLVVDIDYQRAWMHTYPFVSVLGRSLRVDDPNLPWWIDADADVNIDLEGKAGDEARKDDGLDITARFADTLGLCEVIARTAYRMHAPATGDFSAPSLSTSYPMGGAWAYAVLAYDSVGRRISTSATGYLSNGPTFVSSTLRIFLTWDAVENAVDYKVVRVSTPSGSGTSIGVIGVSIGNNQTYQDVGLGADGSVFQGNLLSPRQSAKLVVFDDGTRWRQRGIVYVPDPYGSKDFAQATYPPAWWIENIDRKITSPTTTLSIVMRDAR